MKKTSLYIDRDLDRALARTAASEGISKDEYVRRVLSEAVSGRVRPRAKGVFEGARDLGSETDRHLSETKFGER